MQSPSHILRYAHLRFTPADQEKLGRDLLASLMLLGHIVNELNTVKRLILGLSDLPKDKVMGEAWQIQADVIIRITSAKCYEAIISLDGKLGKQIRAEKDDAHGVTTHLDDLLSEKDAEEYKIVKYLRNKVGHHYDLGVARKAVETIKATKKDASFFVEKRQGNSFSPCGLDVVDGAARLSLISDVPNFDSDIQKRFQEWHIRVIDHIDRILFSLLLVARDKVDLKPSERTLWLENKFGSRLIPMQLPLIYNPTDN